MENNDNFLTLIKSEGKVLGHGDSFYQVHDNNQLECKLQTITDINTFKKKAVILGYF